jgi:protein-S-isoprenylcysteine O-methyltransferase Ste14
MTAPGQYFASHRILVSRVSAVAFFLVVLSMSSAHEGTLTAPLLLMLGLLLVGIATVGRLWCSVYISGYKDAQLITTGPYSLCRNPLYFFSLLGFAGVGFATETVTLGIVLTLLVLVAYPSVIAREEAVLRAKFGAEFERYCAKTPRLLPRISGFAEPETYTVNPRLFRRTMGDVVWFIWLIGIIELVEALHELHIVEPFIQLP